MSRDKELAEAVYSLIKRSANQGKLAESIAAYMIDSRQTRGIGVLLRNIEGLRLDRDDVLEVQVTSAHPLSEATKTSLKRLFDAKKVIINEEQDASLIGGARVRAHDMQLDTSVRTRLQRLKAGV